MCYAMHSPSLYLLEISSLELQGKFQVAMTNFSITTTFFLEDPGEEEPQFGKDNIEEEEEEGEEEGDCRCDKPTCNVTKEVQANASKALSWIAQFRESMRKKEAYGNAMADDHPFAQDIGNVLSYTLANVLSSLLENIML